MLPSRFIPPSPSPPCPQSILYICVSIPVLQIGSSVLFFLGSMYMRSYMMFVFLFSDLLYFVWQTLYSSTSLQMTQLRSSLWLSDIPLYLCTTSFSIHLSMAVHGWFIRISTFCPQISAVWSTRGCVLPGSAGWRTGGRQLTSRTKRQLHFQGGFQGWKKVC